jgi:hypothetical protein
MICFRLILQCIIQNPNIKDSHNKIGKPLVFTDPYSKPGTINLNGTRHCYVFILNDQRLHVVKNVCKQKK